MSFNQQHHQKKQPFAGYAVRDECPIFRDNVSALFPALLRDPEYAVRIRESITKSTMYQGQQVPHIPADAPRSLPPSVHVVNFDSLSCAHMVMENHGDASPLVHNMASDRKAGGGVKYGAKAQEESLARRSTLYMQLDHRYRQTCGDHKEKVRDWYGRDGMHEEELSYNPGAIVVRDADNDLMPRKNWFEVSFISSAAIRRPRCDASGNYMADQRDSDLMRDKYKALLRLAWNRGHRNLVLSAWGSGAFRVPCQHMAEILAELLFGDAEFAGVFNNVYISIIDPYLNTDNYRIYDAEVKRMKQVVVERSGGGGASSSSSSSSSSAPASSIPASSSSSASASSAPASSTEEISSVAQQGDESAVRISKSQARRQRARKLKAALHI